LKAQRDFGGFRGSTEQELLGWLRCTLLNNLTNLARHYRDTHMRELAREIRIDEVQLGALQRVLASAEEAPSTQALAREQVEELERALACLPEHYRQVVLMRHQEGLSFEAIGQRLERSGEAVRKLWARAVEQLQQILEPPHEPQGW